VSAIESSTGGNPTAALLALLLRQPRRKHGRAGARNKSSAQFSVGFKARLNTGQSVQSLPRSRASSVYINYVIIGAPKCGTTSLAQWAREHPALYVPVDKEPHFYSSRKATRLISSRGEYEALFAKPRTRGLSCGEASVWYLYDEIALSDIKRENPDVKVIVCIRSQPEMIQSLFDHKRRSYQERSDSLEMAWNYSDARDRGAQEHCTAEDSWQLAYKEIGQLGKYTSRAIDIFGTENTRVLDLCDLKRDPHGTLDALCGFLGVESAPQLSLPVLNRAAKARSETLAKVLRILGLAKRRLGIRRELGLARAVNHTSFVRTEPSELFKRSMQEFFAEDTLLLDRARITC